MPKNKKDGFTLIELIIVVAIIRILVAAFIPVFSKLYFRHRNAPIQNTPACICN